MILFSAADSKFHNSRDDVYFSIIIVWSVSSNMPGTQEATNKSWENKCFITVIPILNLGKGGPEK